MAERTFNVAIPAGVFAPNLERALAETVPNVLLAAWREQATELSDTGEYMAMLVPDKAIEYPYLGDHNVTSVINLAHHADIVEQGHQGFHLPSRWTGKWKLSKDGRAYAYIPFRHYSPYKTTTGKDSLKRAQSHAGGTTGRRRSQAMPRSVYWHAVRLRGKQRLTGFGDLYKQSKSYNFYRAIYPDFPAQLGAEGYTWKASKYEGMFRTTSPTPQGGRHTEYMTIRTMRRDSPGWFIPPQPGHHFARRALEQASAAIEEILDAAAAQDGVSALMEAAEGVLE